jgi:4-hydroxy-4-methyl-2-oxoglutarate aldolase
MEITSELRTKLYAAVISDSLDALGMRHQALRPFIRPLDLATSMIGRARTGLYAPVYDLPEGENPYEIEIRLVDDLKPGEIAVLACGGPTERIAPWGELLSTAAKARGAAGCVTDGLVRDIRKIAALDFPVFHGGVGPLDSKGRGKMVEMDVPVEIAGVMVRSGDVIFGDADGVVVVPRALEDEVLGLAIDRVSAERSTSAELQQGALLHEVYTKYGVL